LNDEADIRVAGIVFSFGRGKFLRKGGGGCLITGLEELNMNHVESLPSRLEGQFGTTAPYHDCDLLGKFGANEIHTNPTSTRMVVKPMDYVPAQAQIEELRKIWKLDISDGIHDHLSGNRAQEFYVWKRTQL